MPSPLTVIFAFLISLYYLGGFLLSLWWIYVPLILAFLVKGLWLKYIRQKFIQKMDWILLEVIPPRDIQKTPRAIEQFFAGLHGIRSGPNWWDRNILGITSDWFSLEIISQSGEIHFFIRTVSKWRNLIEANIYAQYPESEINQTADYIQSVPSDIPNKDYDLYGTELILAKEDAYPIRTYPDFEKDIAMDEQRIDPIASLLEVMGKLQEGEQVWIQTLIRPVKDDWRKTGEELRNKLIGRAIEKKQGEIKKEAVAWKNDSKEVVHRLIAGESSELKKEVKTFEPNPMDYMSKVEKDIVTAIEENISKIGFETIIRFVYLAPRDIFRGGVIKYSIVGCYEQLNTQHLNSFKRNGKIDPGVNYRIQLRGSRNLYRKKKIFAYYKKRNFPQYSTAIEYLKPFFFERLPILNWFFIRSQPFVFNIEELATVYHYPTLMVKAPLVPKVESGKREPPIGLPVK